VAAIEHPSLLRFLRYRYSPTRIITVKGLKKGVFGGQKGWLIAFLAVRGVLAVKRSVSKQQELITIDQLKPGERIFVRTIPVHSAKERKQLLRGR
jgi:hypothetical protein